MILNFIILYFHIGDILIKNYAVQYFLLVLDFRAFLTLSINIKIKHNFEPYDVLINDKKYKIFKCLLFTLLNQ